MDQLNKYDKQFHYENAKSLLDNDDFQSLRYACLELRFFIEAHVYQQLLAGMEDAPKTVVETWQPNKAIKLLSLFDDLADKDLYLDIFNEDGTDKETITYNNIPIKDLNKIYNSLGSYLHLPMPKKLESYKIKKNKITDIFTKLGRLTVGNLMVVKAAYEYFECEACSQNIIYTNRYIQNNKSIICQNDQCKIEHEIRVNKDTVAFGSRYVFDCGVCEKKTSVFFSKIEDGYSFECENCETKYRFEMILRGSPVEEVTS